MSAGGVNKALGIIRVLAEWPGLSPASENTAGGKDTDCSVCSRDIVHI